MLKQLTGECAWSTQTEKKRILVNEIRNVMGHRREAA